MTDETVETELVDLTGASLVETWGNDAELGVAKARLLSRVDNPKSSFGGYNPQRAEVRVDEPAGNVILAGVVGSTAYGLAHEGSDVDRLGLYVVPTLELFGLDDPPWSIVRTDPDLTMHEAKKWCKLALSCNPTAMELAWLDEYEVIRPLGARLLEIRGCFLSRKAVRNSYLGYATQQLTKIKRRLENGRDGDTRLLSEKNARHLYRLLLQGARLHQTGELMIRLPHPEHVRETGAMVAADPGQGDRLLRWAEEVFDQPGALPVEPDKAAVVSWLQDVRRAYL